MGPCLMLDEMDKRIIQMLQRNARIPNTEIARSLKVTETTIRNRVSRLLDDELIEIVAVVTPKAREATISTFIAITVELNEAENVIASLRERPEIRYLARMLSTQQILAEAFFTDHDHLLRFQSAYLYAIAAVTAVETTLVLRVDKLSYEWEI
jgi:Lrp/AsnC family transcriptional regulator for asnA, asnC and gidA